MHVMMRACSRIARITCPTCLLHDMIPRIAYHRWMFRHGLCTRCAILCDDMLFEAIVDEETCAMGDDYVHMTCMPRYRTPHNITMHNHACTCAQTYVIDVVRRDDRRVEDRDLTQASHMEQHDYVTSGRVQLCTCIGVVACHPVIISTHHVHARPYSQMRNSAHSTPNRDARSKW